MRVLCIYVHPRRTSFTHAVLTAFRAGLDAAGHESTVADLHAEGFAPAFSEIDFGQFEGGETPADVLSEQTRVLAHDAMVFVFPVYWWSFPALLKGWIDRVLTSGWAYEFTLESSRGLLRDRPVLLLMTAGSSERTYQRYAYGEAMQRAIVTGIFGYCGVHTVRSEFLFEVGDDRAVLARHLARAHALGAAFSRAPTEASSE